MRAPNPSRELSPHSAREALDRTLLLMRDHIDPSAPDDVLVDALCAVRVLVVADRPNLRTAAGQSVLVTTVLLAARSGASIYLDLPDVPLLGPQPPLTGDRLLAALLDVGVDLIPESAFVEGHPDSGADLVVLIGDTPWRSSGIQAALAVRVVGDTWAGAMLRADSGGARWPDTASPFGALAAGGLAGGEAYKAAMRSLRPHATSPTMFPHYFAATDAAEVRIAPDGTRTPSPLLGTFDCVSGGAVTQAALFALGRIRDVQGHARIIEPDENGLTNLNRYALLRRSRLGMSKVDDLAAQAGAGAFGALTLAPVPLRFEELTLPRPLPLAPAVLVGVDHVPSRWAVQRERPIWLGVGATDHYLAMASFHDSNTACAGCLHPVDAGLSGELPTLAVVSHWAGLWLASLFARHRTGDAFGTAVQCVSSVLLQPGAPTSTWWAPVPFHGDCPISCRQTA